MREYPQKSMLRIFAKASLPTCSAQLLSQCPIGIPTMWVKLTVASFFAITDGDTSDQRRESRRFRYTIQMMDGWSRTRSIELKRLVQMVWILDQKPKRKQDAMSSSFRSLSGPKKSPWQKVKNEMNSRSIARVFCFMSGFIVKPPKFARLHPISFVPCF